MILIMILSYIFGDTVPKPVLGLIIATLGLIWYWRKRKYNERLKGLKEIPGPKGSLPLLGHILQLGPLPHLKFGEWADEHGPVYQVQLGRQMMIVVSDPKLSKEIFSNEATTGRLNFEKFGIYENHPGLGIFNTEGEMWETHRRFLLRQLRDFGFGKSAMESLIMDEVQEVLRRFKAQEGLPTSEIRETLRLAVVNSLLTILTSKRYDHDDPTLLSIALNATKAVDEVIAKGSLLIFMPWLSYILPGLSGYTAIRTSLEENRLMFENTIKEHKARENDLKDFVDVYLAEVRKTTDTKSFFYGEAAERQLVAELFDLFFAGSDTTSTTLSWAVLYLCKYPQVQKDFQKEISEITGDSRKVNIGDRASMPYTLALIDEVLRNSSINPDGVPHRALVDMEFHGYFVPKDAIIQPNLYYMHRDPKIWGDPENFRPERFLSEDGKKYVKSENLHSFQPGRRQCVGETLARDSLFLYLTNLFQQFSIKFDPKSPEPGLEAAVGFLRAPKPYAVVMCDRLSSSQNNN